MVFKMRCDNIAVGVVGGMLYGAEVGNVHILRDDDKTAGMLTGRAFYADKPESKAVLLRLRCGYTALLKILLDIAVGGLFRQRTDRSGAENVIGAEKHFGIFMRLRLIFAREIKVDIGRFFVAGEAEEGFERDIKALALHLCAAFGTVLFGHIRAAAVGAVGYELAVTALWADVVRGEGIDLRDAGHIRDQR